MRRTNSAAATTPSHPQRLMMTTTTTTTPQPTTEPPPDGLWIDPSAAPSSSTPYMLHHHNYLHHHQNSSSSAHNNNDTFTFHLLSCLDRLWGHLFLPMLSPTPPTTTAHALALDAYTRATIGMSSVLLGPAVLELAHLECPDDDTAAAAAAAAVCRIHGFRPSSILTNVAAVSGVLGSLLLPLFGAWIDHTPYRRAVGRGTAGMLVLIQAIQIAIGHGLAWWTIVILQVGAAMVYLLHLTATLAYVPELTTVTSPLSTTQRQAVYNAAFGMILYVSTLVFVVQVLIVEWGWQQYVWNDDTTSISIDVATARIAQGVATGTTAIGFGLAWGCLFPHRPALQQQQTPSTSTHARRLCTVGFVQTWRTVRTMRPTVLAVLGAVSAGEAASSGLVSVSTTYCKVVLEMAAGEIGVLFLVVLVGAIPGTKLGEVVTRRFGNPLYSLLVCYLCFIVTTSVAATILQGPEDKHAAYGVALLWGVTLGWISPQNTCAFVPLIPADQTTEWMGLYVLSTQILTWFPPLLFTILNEHGWPMSIGLVSLNLAFVVALVLALVALRNYQRVVVNSSEPEFGMVSHGVALPPTMHVAPFSSRAGRKECSSPVLRASQSGP